MRCSGGAAAEETAGSGHKKHNLCHKNFAKSPGCKASGYDPDAALLGIADPEGFVSNLAGLTDRMPGYQWKVFDSADELEQFVEAGGDGGFLLTGKFTFLPVRTLGGSGFTQPSA